MTPVTGLLALVLVGADKAPAPCIGAKPARELALSEAIHIGLAHAPPVSVRCERVEEDGQVYVTIAPAAPGISPPRFKADVMAMVRAIEEQYWNLAQQHAQLRANESAAATARDLLRREQARLQGTVADAAEAEERLEQFDRDVAARTAEILAAERRLRNLLGLPPVDDRCILPTTKPVDRHAQPGADVDRAHGRLDAAARRRAAAAQRLEAQRVLYEEGRISARRYLDAVGNFAGAVAEEAHAKAAYNITLAVREEAKGTLLEYRKVTIQGSEE